MPVEGQLDSARDGGGVHKRLRLTTPALAVLLGMVALTLVCTWAVRSQIHTQETRALQKRSSEVTLTLSAGLSEVRSALGVLTHIPVTAPGSPELFEQVSAPLINTSVRFVGVAERQGANYVLLAVVGEDTPRGTVLEGERAALATRAAGATDFVSNVVHPADGPRIGFALATDHGARVVIREAKINPTTPATSLRGQPFSDVDAALFAAPTASPDALVLSTTASLPLPGATVQQTTSVGSDQWLVVIAARGSLVSSYAQRAPWATLVAGLVLAALMAMVVETLARRRSYALALVQARTAELEQTVQERSELEREARHASAEAIAANKSKSEFLSRMSHELRTPLNAVLGFAQLLEMDDLAEQQRESVELIIRGGRHLLDLINEVLDITRIESGNFPLSPEPVLVGELLNEAVNFMRSLADRHRIHLVGDTNESCDVYVLADRQRLKQILLNLLSNAVKYNRVGGTVAVSCETIGDRLRLSVADTGAGIRPEDVGRLFQPFERLGADRTEVEGSGIGLALSRRLAEAMGGTLDVESSVGQGSTFWVELPLVEGPVERFIRLDGAHVRNEAPTPNRHTIVYIEDNLSNLRLVERLLAQHGGMDLVAAMQGRLGLDLVRQHRPLAVLLDLHLPDIDGDEILRQLRLDPSTASIPVIILSADATPGHVKRLLAAGAHSYLTKPLEVHRLLETLDELVAAARKPLG